MGVETKAFALKHLKLARDIFFINKTLCTIFPLNMEINVTVGRNGLWLFEISAAQLV